MAVETGKTNAKHIRVWVDDYGTTPRDLSASVSNISGTGLTFEEANVTGYSDGVINFVLGHPSSEIEITGPYDNTALIGSHTVFSRIVGSYTTVTLTVQVGIRAAPIAGAPEFEGEYMCVSYFIKGDATYVARLVPASSTVPGWGTMS